MEARSAGDTIVGFCGGRLGGWVCVCVTGRLDELDVARGRGASGTRNRHGGATRGVCERDSRVAVGREQGNRAVRGT
eukprot:4091070-Prymnesium_polylepis.2